MSVSQAEFVASKTEASDRVKKLEEYVITTIEDIRKLQEATALISVQAAPWSVSIETAVAASEAKAEAALTEVRALFEGTKAEVEELRRRATEVEKLTSASKAKGKWEMSRPKDMEVNTFTGKEELWPKFREELIDYAEACHPGIKSQLEYALKPRKEGSYPKRPKR